MASCFLLEAGVRAFNLSILILSVPGRAATSLFSAPSQYVTLLQARAFIIVLWLKAIKFFTIPDFVLYNVFDKP